jgi:hypothetical protein
MLLDVLWNSIHSLLLPPDVHASATLRAFPVTKCCSEQQTEDSSCKLDGKRLESQNAVNEANATETNAATRLFAPTPTKTE